MTPAIREAGPGDAAGIAAVQAAGWRDSYRGIVADAYLDGPIETENRAFWERVLATPVPGRVVKVAGRGDGVEGFVCILPPKEGPEDRLAALYLRAAARGRGTGRALLAAACAERLRLGGRGLVAEVLAGNAPARGFYRALGAVEDPPRPVLLPDGGTAPEIELRWPSLAALVGGSWGRLGD